MKLYTTLLFTLLVIQGPAQTAFETVLGATNHEYLASDIIENPKGKLLIAGTASGGGTGDTDVFLAQLNSQGDTDWVKTFYTPKAEFNVTLINAHDSGYLVSATTYSYVQADADSLKDILILRLDTSGKEVWRKVLSAFDHYQTIQSKSGGYYVYGAITLKGADKRAPEDVSDLIIYKLDGKGTTIWKKRLGTADFDYAEYNGLYELPSGDLIVGASTDSASKHLIVNGYINCISSKGRLKWARLLPAFTNRNHGVNNVLTNNDTLYFLFNGLQALNPQTGQVYSKRIAIPTAAHIGKPALNGHRPVLENTDGDNSILKIYDNHFIPLLTRPIQRDRRIFGEHCISTQDGGYAFLFRWEQGSGMPYAGNFTALVIKTDCNGNSDQWKTCTLGESKSIKKQTAISVYPNPVSFETPVIWVTIPEIGSLDYQLYNQQGQRLQAGQIFSEQNSISLSVDWIGLYYLVFENTTTKQRVHRKIVVQ